MAREKKGEHVRIVKAREPIFSFTVTFGYDGLGAVALKEAIVEKFPYWEVNLKYSLELGIRLVAAASDCRLFREDGTLFSRTMPEDQDFAVLRDFLDRQTDRPKQFSVTSEMQP